MRTFLISLFFLAGLGVPAVLFAQAPTSSLPTNTQNVGTSSAPVASALKTEQVQIFNETIQTKQDGVSTVSFSFKSPQPVVDGILSFWVESANGRQAVKALSGADPVSVRAREEKTITVTIESVAQGLSTTTQERLWVLLANPSGNIVFSAPLGTIKSTSSSAPFPLQLAGCGFISAKDMSTSTKDIKKKTATSTASVVPTQGTSLALGNPRPFFCSVLGALPENSKIVPVVTLYEKSMFSGAQGERKTFEPTVFTRKNGKITFSIDFASIPKKAQVYDAEVFLVDEAGKKVSNTVIEHFVVPGEMATIYKVETNAFQYLKGEVALVNVALSSMPTENSQDKKALLEITLQDSQKNLCGKNTEEFSLGEKTSSRVSIPLSSDCAFPLVTARITKGGAVLAELSVSLDVFKGTEAPRSTPNFFLKNIGVIIGFVVVMLLIVGGVWGVRILFWKKAVPPLLLLLGAGAFLVSPESVFAGSLYNQINGNVYGSMYTTDVGTVAFSGATAVPGEKLQITVNTIPTQGQMWCGFWFQDFAQSTYATWLETGVRSSMFRPGIALPYTEPGHYPGALIEGEYASKIDSWTSQIVGWGGAMDSPEPIYALVYTPTPQGPCVPASGSTSGIWCSVEDANVYAPTTPGTYTLRLTFNHGGYLDFSNCGAFWINQVPFSMDYAVTVGCPSGTAWNGSSCSSLVNGTCGTANGTNAQVAPATNLCASGVASASGQWTWDCNGSGGGANVSCSAHQISPPSAPLVAHVRGGLLAGVPQTFSFTIPSVTAFNTNTLWSKIVALFSPRSAEAANTPYNVHYEVDWDNNGTTDEIVPASGYVLSSALQEGTHTWADAGPHTIQVRAQKEDGGLYSAWTPYSFILTFGCTGTAPDAILHTVVTSPSETTGLSTSLPWTYTANNTATKCEFSCEAGYSWDGTQNKCSASSGSGGGTACGGTTPPADGRYLPWPNQEVSVTAGTNWTFYANDPGQGKCGYHCASGYAWSGTLCASSGTGGGVPQ